MVPVPALDAHLLPAKRPRVYTMHWRLPGKGTRIARTLTRLLAKMDAVVVHSEHGARRPADPGDGLRSASSALLPPSGRRGGSPA